MTDNILNELVAERVMGISLKPCWDQALVAIGGKYVSSTGPVFHLTTGENVPMPEGDTLRHPEGSKNWNDRYFLYVAEFLGERIEKEVEAYRNEPAPYANDIVAAWTVIEKLREMGLVVVMMETPNNRPSCSLHRTTGTARSTVGVGYTMPEAICHAALGVVELMKDTSS